jgi:hypothetical protein
VKGGNHSIIYYGSDLIGRGKDHHRIPAERLDKVIEFVRQTSRLVSKSCTQYVPACVPAGKVNQQVRPLYINDMKNKKGQQNSKEIINADQKERLNRRRFVKGVALGSVLAFGMGIPSPSSSKADILGTLGSLASIYNSMKGGKHGKHGKK